MSHEAYDRVGPFYLQYYSKQRGRGGADSSQEPRFFRGADSWRPRQHGDGFGSLLRGLARFLLPVLGRGIGTFASHTLDATDRGVSLGDAAKSALKPTLRAVIDAGVSRMQKGKGKMKRAGDNEAGSAFFERMQEAKRRKKRHGKQKGAGKRKQKGRGWAESATDNVANHPIRHTNKLKKGKKTHSKKKTAQHGRGKLTKKRVYKTPASGVGYNF